MDTSLNHYISCSKNGKARRLQNLGKPINNNSVKAKRLPKPEPVVQRDKFRGIPGI